MELTKKQIQTLTKLVDRPIKRDWGIHNKICPRCWYRTGHNPVYCQKCGQIMIDFKNIPTPITYRQWILKAPDLDEKQARAVSVLWTTNWKTNPWQFSNYRVKEEVGKEIINLVGA